MLQKFLKRIAWSLNYRFWRIPSFHRYKKYKNVKKNIIISPGGVATTFLIEHVMKFTEVNCVSDRDHLKHIPNIPYSFDKRIKIIFLTSNFEEVYNSLNRRGWVKYNALKLGSPLSHLYPKRILKLIFKRLFLKQKKAFETSKNHSVLIIKYKDIWIKKADIMKHFNIIDEKFLISFPPKKSRSS